MCVSQKHMPMLRKVFLRKPATEQMCYLNKALCFIGIFWRKRFTYNVCKGFLWPQNTLASLAPEANWLLPPPQAYLLYVKASRAHTANVSIEIFTACCCPTSQALIFSQTRLFSCFPNTAHVCSGSDFAISLIPHALLNLTAQLKPPFL